MLRLMAVSVVSEGSPVDALSLRGVVIGYARDAV
jgi:hypothetical protein